MLRTGIDSRHAFSGREVARRLHINPGRETRVEHAAVTDLRHSASAGGCAGGRLVMLQVPAQDRLVAVSPALAGSSAALPVSVTAPGQSAGGTPEHGTVSAASAQRSGGSAPATPSAIESAVIAELPDSNPSATVVVLLGIALLGGLALLSAAGRRVAVRRGLEIAPAGGVVMASGSSVAASRSAPPDAPPASTGEAWLPPAFVASEPAPAPAAEDVPAPAGEPVETSEPSVPEPETPVRAPVPAMPAAPVPAAIPASANQPNPDWLTTHRSQIALALTAAAGGALHLLARGRRRR
jgi:hypothetical protein